MFRDVIYLFFRLDMDFYLAGSNGKISFIRNEARKIPNDMENACQSFVNNCRSCNIQTGAV